MSTLAAGRAVKTPRVFGALLHIRNAAPQLAGKPAVTASSSSPWPTLDRQLARRACIAVEAGAARASSTFSQSAKSPQVKTATKSLEGDERSLPTAVVRE
jgi:hypothetical protein